jgi:hypothetical protein
MKKLCSNWITLLLGLLTLAGCGGGSGGRPDANPVTPGAAGNALVTIGDAPSDRILSFELTVTSILLTDSTGATISVVSNPVRVELTHLAGTFTPLTHISLPQGTYTAVSIFVSHPEMTLVDNTGTIVKLEVPLANGSASTNVNPPLVVGANAVSINVDINVAQSVTFDFTGAASVVLVATPSFAVVAPSENDPATGKIEDIRGTVQSVSGDSFVLAIAGGAQTLTFHTSNNTIFEGITGITALFNGVAVEVGGKAQADGSLFADKVDVEVTRVGEMELKGMITSLSAAPLTSFRMVVHESEGLSNQKPALGTTTLIGVDSRTRFRVNGSNTNLSNVPFPTNFDAASLSSGQEVEVSTEQTTGNSQEAGAITLHEQSLTGVISNVLRSDSGTTFLLTLPADSAFATLTRRSSLTIFLAGSKALTDGTRAQVRGLLFGGSNYRMVASRVTLN